MSKEIPKIQDLYTDVELAKSTDKLMALLNQPPKEDWVKVHPYIKGYRYLPIDKIEFLLKKIFKQYRIEVLREGVAFNGVYVVVRVHYSNPVTNEWDFHDGIGGKELQVKSGSSPADLGAINPGALAMALPIAKTVAIKDACDHFGTLFGSDLNRKDVIYMMPDEKLQQKPSPIEDLNAKVAAQPAITEAVAEEIEAAEVEVIAPEIVGQTEEEAVTFAMELIAPAEQAAEPVQAQPEEEDEEF